MQKIYCNQNILFKKDFMGNGKFMGFHPMVQRPERKFPCHFSKGGGERKEQRGTQISDLCATTKIKKQGQLQYPPRHEMLF